MKKSSIIACLAASAAIIGTSTALAADSVAADPVFEARYEGRKPAVSGFNGKVSLGYTYLNFDNVTTNFNLVNFDASLSAPLGERFGVQIDAGITNLSATGGSINFYGAGAHLFWRDPDVALVGIYGDWTGIDGTPFSFWRLGPEVEVYLDRVSIEGFAGVMGANTGGNTIFTGDLTAAFYATEDLRLDASVIHNFNTTYGRVGVEYQADFNGVRPTLYANATFGNGFQAYTAGLRFYFGGESKSLIRRHREDDPRARSTDVGVGFVGSCAPRPMTVYPGEEFTMQQATARPVLVEQQPVYRDPCGFSDIDDAT